MKDKGSRFVLRESTRDDHEKLDSLVGAFTDRDAYARYLEGMTIFRGSVERRLADVEYPQIFGGWRPGLITAELRKDMADLGEAVPGTVTPFEMPKDLGGLLGVLYVLEGSALGARLLVRRASELGFSSGHGARHLAAQTARPESWTTFVGLLDDLTPSGVENAASAARMTFGAAIRAFDGIGCRERAC